jgi:hypothetical protein
MTPHRADLFNVVDGLNLGVEVADGHVICAPLQDRSDST